MAGSVREGLLHGWTAVPGERGAGLVNHDAEGGRAAGGKDADDSSERPAHDAHPRGVGVRQRLDEFRRREDIVGFFLHAGYEARAAVFPNDLAEGRAVREAVAAALRNEDEVAAGREHRPYVNKGYRH